MFPVTKEVIQMNRIENTDINDLLKPDDNYTFMKTPAGVVTRLTIPAKEITSKIEGRIVNNFSLSLKAMPQDDWKYALSPPSYLLLIPEDSVKTFFEDGMIENNTTIFVSSAISDTLSYSFGNISNLLKYQAKEDPDKDLHMLVIPVERTLATDYYGNATSTSSTVTHYLRPSGVRLRKDPEVMTVSVITSTYSDTGKD